MRGKIVVDQTSQIRSLPEGLPEGLRRTMNFPCLVFKTEFS